MSVIYGNPIITNGGGENSTLITVLPLQPIPQNYGYLWLKSLML